MGLNFLFRLLLSLENILNFICNFFAWISSATLTPALPSFLLPLFFSSLVCFFLVCSTACAPLFVFSSPYLICFKYSFLFVMRLDTKDIFFFFLSLSFLILSALVVLTIIFHCFYYQNIKKVHLKKIEDIFQHCMENV